jgi:hypothetical protein
MAGEPAKILFVSLTIDDGTLEKLDRTRNRSDGHLLFNK